MVCVTRLNQGSQSLGAHRVTQVSRLWLTLPAPAELALPTLLIFFIPQAEQTGEISLKEDLTKNVPTASFHSLKTFSSD